MDNNKKGSNSIIFIFFILILLPSVFLIPITNLFLSSENSYVFLDSSFFLYLSAFISSFSTIIGLLTIYKQINKDKKINSSKFLVDLNNAMMLFQNTRNVYKKLINLEYSKYNKSNFENIFKTDEDKYDLVEYLDFFENIEFLLRKNILKISEVDDMFSKRFFMVVNNPYVQKIKLVKYDYSWTGIYKLARALIEYKKDNNIDIPYEKHSISKTKNYFKYSNGFFNYKSIKNSLPMIFIFSFSLFLIVLFFLLIFFKYPVLKISTIVGTTGTVIGAFAVFFQLNAENNINKARFIFELNKSFISNDRFKKISVLVSKNFYNNLDFSKKNNFIKKINKEDLFDYLVFFESINVMLENKALKINDIFSLIARFMIFVNNPNVQDSILIKNHIFFKNIYKLHKKILKFFKKNNGDIVYSDYSLEKTDSKFYNSLI
ncbi:MAG: hypothetical protein QMB51_03325 [Patescibacteria group bacterium]